MMYDRQNGYWPWIPDYHAVFVACVCVYKIAIQLTSAGLTHTYPKYRWYACNMNDVTYYLGNELYICYICYQISVCRVSSYEYH